MDPSTLIGLGVALVVALYNADKKKKKNAEKSEGENEPTNKNPFEFLKEIQAKLEEQERENQRKILQQKQEAENYRDIKHKEPNQKPTVQTRYQKTSKTLKPSINIKERDIEQEELEKTMDRQKERNSSTSYSEKHSIMQKERQRDEILRLEEEEKNVVVNPFANMFTDVSELKKAMIYKEILDRKEY